MSQPSLDYYRTLFRNDARKVSNISQLLLKDFKLMESRITAAIEMKDVHALRAELHKMHPIVANLQFTKMTNVMKKYSEFANEEEGVEQLKEDFKECLEQIYHLLREQ